MAHSSLCRLATPPGFSATTAAGRATVFFLILSRKGWGYPRPVVLSGEGDSGWPEEWAQLRYSAGHDPERGYTSLFRVQGLSQQIRQLYDILQLLQLQIRADVFREIVSSAVFYLSFGRDDFIDLFFLDSSGLMPKYGRRGFPRLLVPQMMQAIEDLYNAGARNIVVAGVGSLGCTPRVMWEALAGGGLDAQGCVREVNELSLDYNAGLLAALSDLNSRLPGARIVFCDVYAGMLEIISNPATYGFADEKRACCGLGWYGGMVGCLAAEMACEEPSRRVWWDLYNPTATVNELLANWSWTGGPPSICSPGTLGELVSSSSLVD